MYGLFFEINNEASLRQSIVKTKAIFVKLRLREVDNTSYLLVCERGI